MEMVKSDITTRLAELRCVLIRKDESLLMRALALVLGRTFLTDFWTTWKLPFQRYVRIGYPTGISKPLEHQDVIDHELVHARQFRAWGAVAVVLLAILLPLPVLFSGRWFIERDAYLRDIRARRRSIDGAVWLLWNQYGWCWPRARMRRWFERQLAEGGAW